MHCDDCAGAFERDECRLYGDGSSVNGAYRGNQYEYPYGVYYRSQCDGRNNRRRDVQRRMLGPVMTAEAISQAVDMALLKKDMKLYDTRITALEKAYIGLLIGVSIGSLSSLGSVVLLLLARIH